MTFFNKTIVSNWDHNDGYRRSYYHGQLKEEFDEELLGWSCWVYPADNIDLDAWMEENMTGEYVTYSPV